MFLFLVTMSSLIQAIYKERDPEHKLLFLFENVASMAVSDADAITRHLEVSPLRLDAQAISPCRRNRQYWLNWKVPPMEPLPGDGNHNVLRLVVSPQTLLVTDFTVVIFRSQLTVCLEPILKRRGAL